VLQSESDLAKPTVTAWREATVFLGATDNGPKFYNRLRRHIRSLRNDLRIGKIQRENQYDLVLVKDKFLAALIAILATRKHGGKFIYWLSYPFPEASLYAASIGTARYPWFYRIRGHIFSFILYRIIARYAAHIFVQSDQMKLDMAEKGVVEDTMTAVPMGFEPEQIRDQSAEPATTIPGQMVYLGTLLKTRKLDILVRVLKLVKEQKPNATLVYVGPEELAGDADVLEAEAKKLGVEDSLVLTGRLPREDAFKIVRESEVCFSPFHPTPILNSTSPTKLIEYMALKKASVANDHPEQRDVLRESGGGICVPYSAEAFADAALAILKNPAAA